MTKKLFRKNKEINLVTELYSLGNSQIVTYTVFYVIYYLFLSIKNKNPVNTHNSIMLTHFVIYGLLGMLIEVFWTGLGSLLAGNLSLTSRTYIWMFFIYGSAVFLEPIHDIIRRENIILRGIAWAIIILLIEFVSGYILDLTIGVCPWDYSKSSKYSILGYIRLDYFPAWFFAGLLFERVHDLLDKKLDRLIH